MIVPLFKGIPRPRGFGDLGAGLPFHYQGESWESEHGQERWLSFEKVPGVAVNLSSPII